MFRLDQTINMGHMDETLQLKIISATVLKSMNKVIAVKLDEALQFARTYRLHF
ncbi:hypothetical protein POX_d05629 [Penicillium oxalicum]|uniref:Uncharacterized protein n=1 Tax=Penicillium oxalicum (strain 114-2 / CGMCC 5302) TaxID=933388 RepID=S7ZTV1_PENO1|nr:hypothetical protein POX_d05629 [Penicillium oxalicum]EPS32206.1 hypothetical protein PDE_07166 [Penicillium oxalicum 114-2]KAI2790124.1 hypothetical protein POX_d05629 [Penicillium oxalicum]